MPRDLLTGKISLLKQQQPRDLLVDVEPFQFGGGQPRRNGIGGTFEVPTTALEKRIAQRPDMMSEFIKELTIIPQQFSVEKFKAHPIKAQVELGLKPAVTALKFIGGGVQRGTAAISNIGLVLQKGKISPKILAKEAWKGITGEKLGELGDWARGAGWPEPIAATLGLLAQVGLGNLATKGKIVENINRAKNVAIGKLPKVMGKDYVKVRAEEGVKALKDLRKTLGTEVKTAIDKVDDVAINAQQLSKNMPRLPSKVLSALDDPIYGIEKLRDGSYKPTVGNLHKIKEALDDFMSTKTWEEAGKKSQQLVKQAYGVIRKTMGEVAPEINEPMRNYSSFMDTYRKVLKTVQDTSGTILEKKLRGAMKPEAERAYQQAWEDFAKMWPRAGQIMKDVVKYNQRQATKQFIGRAAKWGLGIEAGRRFIAKPILRAIEGVGGGGEYEGGGY